MRLYDKMQEKNFSLRGLAAKAGVSTATVGFILNGRRGEVYYPTGRTRQKLCAALGVRNAMAIDEFAVAIEYFKRRGAGG